MSFLNRSQMTKEDFLDSEAEEDCEEDAHICQYHKTGIALREIDAGRVEIRPLLEGGKNNSGCKRRAYRTIRSKTHLFAFSDRASLPAGLGTARLLTVARQRNWATYDNVAYGELIVPITSNTIMSADK